ncbi:hypothetical protein IW150_004671, partial [Coemansia sp. RSA 2607]
MSPRSKAPSAVAATTTTAAAAASTSRPSTPSNLGLGNSTNNNSNATTPTTRSVSNSSSTSIKGVAPCFHTTRPQLISSHIERCEACRLKYQRKAEAVTRPYSPSVTRRTPGAPPRSASRQSVGGNSGINRPSSAASIVSLPSPGITPLVGYTSVSASTAGAATQSNASLRSSSRASVASARTADTGRSTIGMAGTMRPKHSRSSSAGSPLVDDRANVRRAVAQASEKALGNSSVVAMTVPPSRGDGSLSTISSSDSISMSPTVPVAMRSRVRTARNSSKQQAASNEGSGNGSHPRESRRGSSHSIHSHRRVGNESPTRSIKNVQRMESLVPPLPKHENGEKLVYLDEKVLLDAMNATKLGDEAALTEQKDTAISRLQEENRQLRRLMSRQESELSASPKSSGLTNIFETSSVVAKQHALDSMLRLDKVAIDAYEEFHKAYDDFEPSLRSNRVQFEGERPLSPPPGRQWASTAATPMRGSIDIGDHDSRFMNLANTVDVRRTGVDLMSTPLRSAKPHRILGATSTRRPPRSRVTRPAATPLQGDSDVSDDDLDSDGIDNEDDHQHLRNRLMDASRFGMFLVQYISR